MASPTIPQLALSRDLRSLLAGLRWRIRVYIWLEGLSLAVAWLGLMFWLGLGLDWLPVLLGASEMPHQARAVLLAATGIGLAAILYRWVLSRTFVPLSDRSMALLLERNYDAFNESLVTTVELAHQPDHAAAFNPQMLAHTTRLARQAVEDVRYGRIFNLAALSWRLAAAIFAVASLILFLAANSAAFELAARRLLLLSDAPWPRSARIEVVGIEVIRTAAPGQESARSATIPFEGNVVKVARGANVSLKVRAAQPPQAKYVPEHCTVYYRTLKTDPAVRGERGSVTISNYRDIGSWRNFWFDGKPFRGVLATMEFDVLGYDHRASGYKLEVVDTPAVVETLLDLVYPSYMVDEATSSHLPVENLPYVPARTFIPVGTQVTLRFKTNKMLKRAQIVSSDGSPPTLIDIAATAADRRSFAYRVDALSASTTLDISLLDADNVETERPFRVFLTAVEDQPPQVEVALKGIGSAVTPDVVIPFRGKVSDDYAVAKTWFEVQINDAGDRREVPFELAKSNAVEHQIDFRDQRAQKTSLEIKPGDKLMLAVKAADKFDLSGEPHMASGDRYQLDVVTPEQLLAQLEVREIGLRRRFELIIDEMTQLRDSLLRAKASLLGGGQSPAAGSVTEELTLDADAQALSPEKKAEREAELRLLRVQRAQQQSQKSAAEVLGVAAGFLDIREELINNRVDTEDRKSRLKEQIADPLNQTCAEQFPRLDQRLAALETKLREGGVNVAPGEAGPLADQAIDQANVVLGELEAVLAKMQDLETYNELLDLVRDMLKDQEKLLERTQQERKRETLQELKKLE